MPSADADLPAESSSTTANSHSSQAKKGPMAFLRDLPTLNSANFSKFSHDSIVLQQSPSNKSIVTQSRSDEDSIPIVTEKTSIMLRYLHRAWEKKKDEAASKKRAIAEIDSDSPGPSNAGLSGEPRRKMPRTS